MLHNFSFSLTLLMPFVMKLADIITLIVVILRYMLFLKRKTDMLCLCLAIVAARIGLGNMRNDGKLWRIGITIIPPVIVQLSENHFA